MPLEERSTATLEFAEQLRHRLLGNADDQRLCLGAPNRLLEYGILFSQYEAGKSRRGARTDIRPNALTVRFEVAGDAPVLLTLRPSFWLYARSQSAHLPPANAGDLFTPEIVWADWGDRPSPTLDGAPGEALPDDHQRVYIRYRYCKSIQLVVDSNAAVPQTVDLDLPGFRNQLPGGLDTPIWAGEVEAIALRTREGNLEVTVRLINTYKHKARGESAWFDVRMKIVQDRPPFRETFCPILNASALAQTMNCVLSPNPDGAARGELEVEQVNLARRLRQEMRPGDPFATATWESNRHVLVQIATEPDATPEHSDALMAAITAISADRRAIQAVDMTLEAMRRAMRVRLPDPNASWHRHQLAVLALGASDYLTGGRSINPLVLNVPTAGGKTEAFCALALWSVAYEALAPQPRWGTAIIKYPTKLLSKDQAQRLAHYVMHFDDLLVEQTGREEERRGLGLFFGSDSDELNRLEVIGRACPECNQPFSIRGEGDGPRRAVCPNDHQVVLAIKNEIFPRPPALIVGTIDKFVSKATRGDMARILGAEMYYCDQNRIYSGRNDCWDSENRRYSRHDHRPVARRSVLTTLILDEAHLLREEVGSLDAHFETLYMECAQELAGRYPLTVVSTATIAQAEEHCAQLGFGQPSIFPGRQRENYPLYYRENPDRLHHVVLSCMPRGRAIAWALPHTFGHYLDVLRREPAQELWRHLRPLLAYCGTYTNRNMIRESIKRHIEPNRGDISIGEFSRRQFDDAGMQEELDRLNTRDIVLSTNIASVGVDLGALNSILYFGMPSNINEFIQSLNRTGRQDPAIAVIVHNPYLERDASFYAYLDLFLSRPEALVEAVPLNRFARRAVEHTLPTLTLVELLHIWNNRPELADYDITKLQRSFTGMGFQQAINHSLNPTDVENLLQRTYRSEQDPSGAYPDIVRRSWLALCNRFQTYRPRRVRGLDNDNQLRAVIRDEIMYQLRTQAPEGRLEYNDDARQLARANVRAIYGSDRDETPDVAEEEHDIEDGALRDALPGEND